MAGRSIAGRRIALGVAVALLASLSVGPLHVVSLSRAAASTIVAIYVSPSGRDSNPGTKSAPVHTLERAQALVRTRLKGMHSDVFVYLESGTYRLATPLKFTAADSGRNGHTVHWTAAPHSDPVISGAVRITGWKPWSARKGVWVASLPKHVDTRQIYVNGMRASMAAQSLTVALTKTSTGYTASSPLMAGWHNPTEMNFVYYGGMGRMTESSCPVASISGESITMAQPCWDNSNMRRPNEVGKSSLVAPGVPDYIENARELLALPGQFYIDRAGGHLYYLPRPGERMSSADVEAPVLQQLVVGQGTPANPIRNLTFSGIQFSYATWLQPSSPQGFSEVQANFTLTGANAYATQGLCSLEPGGACPYGDWTEEPGSVQFSYDQNVGFLDDEFVHLGSAALNLDDGSQSDNIEGSVFTDVSGNGIELGNVNMPEAVGNSQTLGVEISNNHIYDVGVEFHGAVGIFVGYAADITITHNQLNDLPYSGISIGWGGWLDKLNDPVVTNYSHNNVISSNLIYDYMQVVSDGGAVYTQGITGTSLDNGEMVTGNVVHDQLDWSEALKSDDGATYVTDSNNVLYNNAYDWGNYHADTNGDGPAWDAGVVEDNYWQQGFPTVTQDGVQSIGNSVIASPSQAPASIVDNAGLTAEYRSTLKWSPPGRLLPYPPQYPAALNYIGSTAWVTWHPSSDMSGRAISSYTVTPCSWSQGQSQCTAEPSEAATISATQFNALGYLRLSGLTGSRLSFSVVAHDSSGSSTPSIQSNVLTSSTTGPNLPGPAQNIGSGQGVQSVRLSWYPPSDSTCALPENQWCSNPVLGYQVKDDLGDTFNISSLSQLIVSNHAGRINVILGGLDAGHTYDFTVAAVNASGMGTPEAFVPIVPGP